MSEIALVIVGWLLGTLSPTLTEAISRRRKRGVLLAAIATELHELRYKLALVAHRVRSKSGRLDQKTLDLVKPIILGHSGPEEDSPLAEGVKKLLAMLSDEQYISMHNAKGVQNPGIWPVPYRVPFLESHLHEIDLFTPRVQELLLRLQTDLHFFEDQVGYVRLCLDRTFAGLSSDNFKVNEGNLDAGTFNLATRAESIIWAINQLIDVHGNPIPAAS